MEVLPFSIIRTNTVERSQEFNIASNAFPFCPSILFLSTDFNPYHEIRFDIYLQQKQ